MSEHAKKETKHKTEHKESSHKSHAKKSTEHKAEPKQAAANNDTSKLITVAVISAIVAILLFQLITWGIGSIANLDLGSGSSGTDYASARDGALVIIEYSDFECPFCARALPSVEQVKETYGDAVIIDYRHFPLSFHPNAAKAGEASECARDQEMFWEYHDILFANQNALDVPSLKRYASNLGLDTAEFNSCLDSGEKAGIVAADMAEGQKAGVTGTPTFIIEGEQIVGAQPFSAFKTIIDRKLGESGSDYVAPVPVDDPVVYMTVIEDADCSVCDTSTVISFTQNDLFPTVEITTLQKDDAKAQQLIADLNINALPAYIFEESVTEAAKYGEVSQALIKVGNQYIINPSATGDVRLLEVPDVSGRPVKGDMDAPVTIIEWSDFECPFCKRFYDDAYQDLVTQYVNNGDVKIVFMHFPLSFHQNAENAAIASECAGDQGKFWEYHDILFANQNALTVPSLKGYAVDLGLDTTTFDSCLDNKEHAAQVAADMALGQSVGVSGTPGFLVNGVSVSGAQPFEVFQGLIDAELGN